ncbi:MAG: hypothetical protein MPJ24_03720 [Pirellulaceae bacterium]|nr:hypothetical protein [Pirellulaceae bacterium]
MTEIILKYRSPDSMEFYYRGTLYYITYLYLDERDGRPDRPYLLDINSLREKFESEDARHRRLRKYRILGEAAKPILSALTQFLQEERKGRIIEYTEGDHLLTEEEFEEEEERRKLFHELQERHQREKVSAKTSRKEKDELVENLLQEKLAKLGESEVQIGKVKSIGWNTDFMFAFPNNRSLLLSAPVGKIYISEGKVPQDRRYQIGDEVKVRLKGWWPAKGQFRAILIDDDGNEIKQGASSHPTP